jgi:hypothetical protein
MIMRVEEDADVKEEDIPVAVKFSTANWNVEVIFTRRHSVAASPLTLHNLGTSQPWWFDTTFWPFIHLMIITVHFDIHSWTPARETNIPAHKLRPCPMSVIAIPLPCHSH